MKLNIKKAIAEKGLTSKQVAERMNISPVGLSQHINGNPTVDTLEKIAAAIGCEISEFFEDGKRGELKCPNCGVELNVKIE